MINIAFENQQIFGDMSFNILQYWIGAKFRAYKHIFRALGTIVSRKFEPG